MPVAAVVNDVLSGSHATLEAVFQRAGAPGPAPSLSHASKWKVWLLQANADSSVEPLAVLGKVIEEFMEVEPRGGPDELASWREKRERLEEVLQRYNLRYRTGGRVISVATGPASATLKQALSGGDFHAVTVEFERALESVESDPGAAATAASAILEALFQTYIEQENLTPPNDQSIKPLWSVVQKDLGLNPKDQTDQDVQKVLSGLTSIVDGIGSFRTHAGSAHGGGKKRYRIEPRHARLMVNSAHSLATFLIETWQKRKLK